MYRQVNPWNSLLRSQCVKKKKKRKTEFLKSKSVKKLQMKRWRVKWVNKYNCKIKIIFVLLTRLSSRNFRWKIQQTVFRNIIHAPVFYSYIFLLFFPFFFIRAELPSFRRFATKWRRWKTHNVRQEKLDAVSFRFLRSNLRQAVKYFLLPVLHTDTRDPAITYDYYNL